MAKDRVEVEIVAEIRKAVTDIKGFAVALEAAKVVLQKVAQYAKEYVQWVVESIDMANEATQVQARLNSALHATGGAVGYTSDQLQAMASELSALTAIEDDAISEAQALLLTFKSIGRDVFPQTVRAAADLSKMLGIDMKAATLMLGRALEDPIRGMTALRRAGVIFSEAQKDAIADMVKSGDVGRAQRMILEELAGKFGGVAEAAGNVATNALNRYRMAVNELKESHGRLNAQALEPTLNLLTKIANAQANANNAVAAAREVLRREAEGLGYVGVNLDDAIKGLEMWRAMVGAGTATGRQYTEVINKLVAAQRWEAMGAMEAAKAHSAKAQAEMEALLAAERLKEAIAAETEEWAAAAKAERDMAAAKAAVRRMQDEDSKARAQYRADIKKTAEEETARIEVLRAMGEAQSDAGPTEEQLNGLMMLARTYKAEVTPAIDKTKEALKELADAVKGQLMESMKAASMAIGTALVDSAAGMEAMKDVLKSTISSMLQMLAQFLFTMAAAAFPNPVLMAAYGGAGVAALVAAGVVAALAEGGIVTSPTLALIGERGPEAVIPLGAGGVGGGVNINVYGSLMTERDFIRRIRRELSIRGAAA